MFFLNIIIIKNGVWWFWGILKGKVSVNMEFEGGKWKNGGN
jgi:hypothetical protein